MDGLDGGGGRGAASARQAQGQRGEPVRGAEGARPSDRDWGTVPDPLGNEALPLFGEVYGWLCWANQGTTRGLRNRPFDAVLLRRDRGNQEVPPGGWAAPKDHERVLMSVMRAAWPEREPTWPAFLEGGAVLRITDADAKNWLPRALRSALAHWRYRRGKPAAATAPAPTQAAAQVTAPTADARKWGGELGPPTHAPPMVRRVEGASATSRGGEGEDQECGGEPTAPQPANR